MEYFSYEESGRGCYMFQDHVGLMARVYQHLKVLEQTHDEIIASRDLPQVQYVHELCSQPRTQFHVYKLASLPTVLEADILQFQMKQMAIFMEQVYVIYFGNFSGKPEMQAIIDSLRPLDMPMVQGVGANRKLPMSDPMLTGQVSVIRSDFLMSLIKSYFNMNGACNLEKSAFFEIFEQYDEKYPGTYKGPLDRRFRYAV
jgi:hypothetical protein